MFSVVALGVPDRQYEWWTEFQQTVASF